MSEELKNIVDEIISYEISSPQKVEIELYNINKTTLLAKLLINTDVTFKYIMENRTYDYRFIEPIYVHSISIKSKANDLKGMMVIVIDSENKEVSFNIENYTKFQFIKVDVKNIIKGFKIIPPSKSKKEPKINLEKIEVFGYKISQYDELKKNALGLEKLSKSLKDEAKNMLEKNTSILSKIEEESKKLEILHEELDNEINELTEKKETLEKENIKLETQITQKNHSLNGLNGHIDKAKINIEDLRKQEQVLKDSLQQKEATSQNLNVNISNEQAKLQKLESDTSLIAYDIQAYVENANKDIQVYLWLSGIPWVLIALVTGFVFWGSAELTTVLKIESQAQIWTIFLSRMPFVIAAGTVLFVAYEISNIFVRRIIEIHQQKSDFAKIGIIAKDVSDASMDGLELTDKEKFELRTKLKMDMLKSHLSRELGKKYECKINPNIWVKYGDILTLKKKTSDNATHNEDEVLDVE